MGNFGVAGRAWDWTAVDVDLAASSWQAEIRIAIVAKNSINRDLFSIVLFMSRKLTDW